MSDMTNRDTRDTQDKAKTPPPAEQAQSPQLSLAFSRKPAAWHIILIIGTESSHVLRVEVKGQLTIGYADPITGFIPDLDLSAYGAQKAGVSHRHAILHAALGGLHIRDLDSEYGIILNGLVLDPKKLHKLREGDVLEFGQLRIVLQSARLASTFSLPSETLPAGKQSQPKISAKSLRRAIDHLRSLPVGLDGSNGVVMPPEETVAAASSDVQPPDLSPDAALHKRQTQVHHSVDTAATTAGQLSQPSQPAQPLPQLPLADSRKPALWHVTLGIGAETPHQVRVEVKDQLMIGYADPATGFVPDLDLSAYGAQKAGVSHRHAILHAALGGLHIRDLDSEYGIILNGLALDPKKLHKLREGDVLEFGQLSIVVQAVHAAGMVEHPVETDTAAKPSEPMVSAKSLRRAIDYLRTLPLGRNGSNSAVTPSKEGTTTIRSDKRPDGSPDTALYKRQTQAQSRIVAAEAALDPALTANKKTALWSLVLGIGAETPQLVRVEIKDQLMIGYADPATGFAPDLDLGAFGARETGVSYRHAVIKADADKGKLHIRDLGSLHGTMLNGLLLDPKKLYNLREGDVLELGQLRIVLQTVRQSITSARMSATRPAVRLEQPKVTPTKTEPLPDTQRNASPGIIGPLRPPPAADENTPAPRIEARSDWSLEQEVYKRQTQDMLINDDTHPTPLQGPQPTWVVHTAPARKSMPIKAAQRNSSRLQRQTLVLAAAVVIGIVLLTGVSLTIANQTTTAPKPTALPLPTASASDAFAYFRKVGLPISNFQMLNTPNTTWKAREEIRFDVKFGDGQSSMLVLSYDTPAQAGTDAANIAQQETLKRMRVTQVSNFLVVAFPDVPQALNADITNHLKQYLVLFSPPPTVVTNKK